MSQSEEMRDSMVDWPLLDKQVWRELWGHMGRPEKRMLRLTCKAACEAVEESIESLEEPNEEAVDQAEAPQLVRRCHHLKVLKLWIDRAVLALTALPLNSLHHLQDLHIGTMTSCIFDA